MLSRMKKLLSVFLILSILIITSTSSVFAKEQAKIDMIGNDSLKVVEDGKVNYINVVEDYEFRNVYIKDEDGNLVGNFRYNKITGELYSSFAGKTFNIQKEESEENRLSLFSHGNRSMGCDPNGTYTKGPDEISYKEILEYVNNYVTAVAVVAFIFSIIGVAVQGVANTVVEGVSVALSVIDKYDISYLNKHGIKFYYDNGRCR